MAVPGVARRGGGGQVAEVQVFVFVCVCERGSEVPRSAGMRLCGAGDTSLSPRDAAAGALRRAQPACALPCKGCAAAGAAAASPRAKVHLMDRLAHTGPDWGCVLNCLKQWSLPGDKRGDEKSEWTGELWSCWRNA